VFLTLKIYVRQKAAFLTLETGSSPRYRSIQAIPVLLKTLIVGVSDGTNERGVSNVGNELNAYLIAVIAYISDVRNAPYVDGVSNNKYVACVSNIRNSIYVADLVTGVTSLLTNIGRRS